MTILNSQNIKVHSRSQPSEVQYYLIHKFINNVVQWNHEHILGVQFHYIDAKGHHHEGHDETKFKPFGTLFG